MKIVVGYDGSEASKKAIEKAKELTSDCKIFKITILHVHEQGSDKEYTPAWNLLQPKDLEEAGEEVFGEELKELNEAAKEIENSEVETKVLKGKPAKVIADFAREEGYDLIIVGSRGQSGLKKLFPGSVSRAVVDNCCVSVMVVK